MVKFDLITIFTDDVQVLSEFYKKYFDLTIKNQLEDYVEFGMNGIRFSICSRKTMIQLSDKYNAKPNGFPFELAFKCDSRELVVELHNQITSELGSEVSAPQEMPWGHYTSMFADPDGNIHELFCDK